MNGRREQFLPGLQPGLPPAAAFSLAPLRRLVSALLLLCLAVLTLPAAPACALPLPWQRQANDGSTAGLSHDRASLQEVPPPAAVQQLQAALGQRQPVVEILSPEDDTVLPAGPWTLKLGVHDWPLVDGGSLGVGPHLVVQLDEEPPRIWTRTEGILPELSPGSHRLTVYAALPWGEARKNPGATRQIRLHRTAANPLSLPAASSPQLLAVSPSGPSPAEPLLLDWLLLDAPLQDVGGRGIQWRLRVSINDEVVLLDEPSPLWLQGWQRGLNTLRLELLDARGEPLNPPFNSLVQEVVLSGTAPSPRWREGPLSASELAVLLGERPPSPGPEDAALPSPLRSDQTAAGSEPPSGPDVASGPSPVPVAPEPVAPPPPASADGKTRLPAAVPSEDSADLDPVEPTMTLAPAPDQTGSDAARSRPDADQHGPADGRPAAPGGSTAGEPADTAAPSPAASGPDPDLPAEANTPRPLASSATGPDMQDRPTDQADTVPDPPEDAMTAAPAPPSPATTPPSAPTERPNPTPAGDDPDRIRASTALEGRARDLVNEDGTLRRPEHPSPIAGLLARLQR